MKILYLERFIGRLRHDNHSAALFVKREGWCFARWLADKVGY